MSEIELDVLDLKEMVLSNNSFGPSDVGAIRTAITENYGHFGELRDAVGDMLAVDTHTGKLLTPTMIENDSSRRFSRRTGSKGASGPRRSSSRQAGRMWRS